MDYSLRDGMVAAVCGLQSSYGAVCTTQATVAAAFVDHQAHPKYLTLLDPQDAANASLNHHTCMAIAHGSTCYQKQEPDAACIVIIDLIHTPTIWSDKDIVSCSSVERHPLTISCKAEQIALAGKGHDISIRQVRVHFARKERAVTRQRWLKDVQERAVVRLRVVDAVGRCRSRVGGATGGLEIIAHSALCLSSVVIALVATQCLQSPYMY